MTTQTQQQNTKQGGFIIVTVLFLIVVLAAIGIVMTTTSGVQQFTTIYSLQGARAFAAARSGLDYGIDQAVISGVCTNGGVALPGINFNVVVSCTSITGIDEGGNIIEVFTIISTATTGNLGTSTFITRSLRATVT